MLINTKELLILLGAVSNYNGIVVMFFKKHPEKHTLRHMGEIMSDALSNASLSK